MMNRILFVACMLFASWGYAQDVNCQVEVNSDQIADADPVIFEALEKGVFEFVNNTKWTTDIYKPEERIQMAVILTLQKRSGSNYEGTIQVQSSRPVYNSSYNTIVFNHQEGIQFSFTQFDVLNFSENNATTNNLTAVLAYYVYVIVGMDYDSFALNGGTTYFQKALNIANQFQGTTSSRWLAFESTDTRYWIVNNLLDPRFKNLRQTHYDYHRKGLDQLAEGMDEGRAAITTALNSLDAVNKNVPNSISLRIFFTSKRNEIVNIYSEAPRDEKSRVISLLEGVDPGNIQTWMKIND